MIERLVAVVARNADLNGWPPGDAAMVLSMLGVDAREAKQALRASRRRRWVQSLVPKPAGAAVRQLEPVSRPLRDRAGLWLKQDTCAAGLHANVPANRITRPDRRTTQCEPCTKARKSSPENLARRRARAKELRDAGT